MKKFISFSISIIVALSFLTGCIFSGAPVEKDIIFLQAAGPFYTSDSKPSGSRERVFLRERVKTVNEIINRTKDAFRHLGRAKDGFSKYEENLLDYIEKAEINADVAEAADLVIAGIAANRALLLAYETEIETYKNAKTSNDATEAIFNFYMFESILELTNAQVLYSDWLKKAAASVSYIVSMTNERKAEKVISSSASIYKRKIHADLMSAVNSVDSADNLYGALVSVDYHSTSLYLVSAKDILSEIKNGKTKSSASDEVVENLEEAVADIMDSIYEPDGLLPLHENKEGYLLSNKVYAAKTDTVPDFTSLSDSLKYYRNETTEPTTKGDFSDKQYSDDVSQISEKITDTSRLRNIIEDTGADISIPEDKSKDDQKNKRMENIGLIGIGQTTVRGIRLFSTDSAYSTAINRIAALIAGGKNISPEAAENALNLVKNELNDLIGINKDEFLDVLLTQSAEEVYGTFEVWRDDIGDLNNHEFTRSDLETFLLLLGYGIEAEEIDQIAESSSPDSTSSPLTTMSPEPSGPVGSQEPSEEIENYDVFNIIATYDTMMNLSNTLTNENLLYIIYEWSDPVNYSGLEKEDKPDGEGGIRGWEYSDSDGKPLGWEVTQYGDTVEYVYHFPENLDCSMKIIRKGSIDSSEFYQVETKHETSGRRTAIRFNEEPEFDGDSITYIYEDENGIKDGLNTTKYNSNPTFEVYITGDLYESYTFRDGFLIREAMVSYEGSSVLEHTRLYFANGRLKLEKYEKDGKENGLYTSYNDDGTLITSIEYTDGQYDGKHQQFFDDGHMRIYSEYTNGEMDGKFEKYFSDEGHPLNVKGQYSNGEMHGKWESFTREGNPKSLTTYSNGMRDGEYKSYATGSTSASSIHTFGQYSNDKKSGVWLYGYNNEGWVEKVYYENDIKVWKETSDSNIRTYYNPDGSVSHTENKP